MLCIEELRERIETSDDLSDADREALLTFSNELQLRRAQYSDHRHDKLLRHCTLMAECKGGLVDALKGREQAKPFVTWIHNNFENEETNRYYRGLSGASGNCWPRLTGSFRMM